jgi:hypothetical protein
MHWGDEKCIQNLVGKLEEKNHSENLDIDGKTLDWIGKVWTGFICLRIGPSGRPLLDVIMNFWVP